MADPEEPPANNSLHAPPENHYACSGTGSSESAPYSPTKSDTGPTVAVRRRRESNGSAGQSHNTKLASVAVARFMQRKAEQPTQLPDLLDGLFSPSEVQLHMNQSMINMPAAWDDAAIEQQWSLELERGGSLPKSDADRIAALFSKVRLPSPCVDTRHYMTHDFLREVGVRDPGERARVIIAVHKIQPPPVKPAPPMVDFGRKTRLKQVMGDRGTSYSPDSTKVTMFKFSPKRPQDNVGWKWIDLVGSDKKRGSAGYQQSEIAKHFQELQILFETSPALQQSCWVEHDGEVNTLAMPREESTMTPSKDHVVIHRYENEDDANEELTTAGSVKTPWDIAKTMLPLPHMVIGDDTNFASFVLRVCTLGTSKSDATVGALTNRWMVFVDVRKQIVATVHRTDSAALAALRDKNGSSYFDKLTFEELITVLFFNFLQEFEIALDESNAILDDSEARMLEDVADRSEIISVLFHLDRKASVYERMIDLNESLIHEVASHFSLSRDLSILEAKWSVLRQKSLALQQRAAESLNLVLALSGHRTNELMATLTKFTIAFTPLTFLCGLYGMNFVNMPELQYEYGYFILLGVLAAMFIAACIGMKFAGL